MLDDQRHQHAAADPKTIRDDTDNAHHRCDLNAKRRKPMRSFTTHRTERCLGYERRLLGYLPTEFVERIL